MRKILFILLLLFITLITSCDSISDGCIHKWIRNDLTYVCELCGEKQVLTDEIQKKELSKEEWNIHLNKDNYKNYTLEYSMYGDDPSFTYVLSYNKFNISETNVSFTNKENGVLIVDNISFPIEEAAIYRYLYETLFTKLLEKYEDFEIYERENQMYKAVKDIIVEINIEESGMKLICTFKDAMITLDENYKLSLIQCYYNQETYFDGESSGIISGYTMFNLHSYATTSVNSSTDFTE